MDEISEIMPDKAREILNTLQDWRKTVDVQLPVMNPNFKEN